MWAKWYCLALSALFFGVTLVAQGDTRGSGMAIYWILAAIFFQLREKS